MKKFLLTVLALMMCAVCALPLGCTAPDEQPKGEPKDKIETEYFTYSYTKAAKGYSVKATEAAKSATTLTVPDEVEGWPVVMLADYCFIRFDSLKSVTLSKNLVSIGSSAFASCSSLEAVTVPESVRTIKDNAFKDCKALQTARLPQDMRSIGRAAFSGCGMLSSVNIPGGITVIPDSAFQNCALSKVTIPQSVVTLGSYAFGNNEQLTEVVLHTKLEKIGQYAFYSCTALEEILFPTGNALVLDDYAFARSGLKKVYLPEDIQLGTYVFQQLRWDEETDTSSCEAIYYESPNGSRGINAFGYTWDNPEKGFRIYVPIGSMDYYKSENPGDESWGRCVVNVSNDNPVLAEYDIATTFPDGFPKIV